MRNALAKRGKGLGDGVIEVRSVNAIVYVRRGPNWSQRDAGTLAHIPAHSGDAASFNERKRERRAQTNANGQSRGKAKAATVEDFD